MAPITVAGEFLPDNAANLLELIRRASEAGKSLFFTIVILDDGQPRFRVIVDEEQRNYAFLSGGAIMGSGGGQ